MCIMAKFTSTTFGTISGKHGTAVAAVQKDGSTILKVYRKPSNPNTPKQQAVRARFTLVNKSFRPLNEVMKLGFKSTAEIRKQKGKAFKEAVKGEFPDLRIDFSCIKIAAGSLQAVESATVETVENSTEVILNWNTTLGFQSKLGANDDQVNFVFYNEASGTVFPMMFEALREDGTASVMLPDVWKEQEIHCWCFLTDAMGENNSDSYYIDHFRL